MTIATPPSKYRIKEEDVLDPESLLLDAELQVRWPKGKKDKGHFPWVRTAAYKQGHLLSPDGMTAYCGRPIYPPAPILWSALQEIAKTGGKELEDYWVAHDRRKGEKCKTCKPAKGMPVGHATWEENELVQSMEEAVSENTNKPQPLVNLTPSERMARQRLNSTAARVIQQIGGTIEN